MEFQKETSAPPEVRLPGFASEDKRTTKRMPGAPLDLIAPKVISRQISNHSLAAFNA